MTWHKLRVTYFSLLIRDCRDEKLKDTLLDKVLYHQTRLNEWTNKR